jgi:hypothetical protein
MSLAFPALGRSMGSPGGGRSAMGPIMSGPRIGGGAGGFQGGTSGYRGSFGSAPRATGSMRGAIGGFRGSFGTAPSGIGGYRGGAGSFRGSIGVPSRPRSGFSPSYSGGFSSRSGSGWFSTARRDFRFGFASRHFDRDVFILSFGFPFFDFYYPFYGSFAFGLGYWYPYYPYYPYYAYLPYYPYGYYPGYVCPPPYVERDDHYRSPAAPSSLGDELIMQWQRGGKLLAGWSGHAARVQQVEFSLLDSQRQLLMLQVARREPYRTVFSAPPDEAAYLQMAVVYTDGSVDSVIRPLPGAGTSPEGSAGYY